MESIDPPHNPPGWSPDTDTAAAPPGWYPIDADHQRYWDGAEWTDHTAPLAGSTTYGDQSVTYASSVPQSDCSYAMLMHLLGLFVTVLAPLIMWALKKDESPFIDHHGKEALNFHITAWIAMLISIVLVVLTLGLFLIGVLVLVAIYFVLPIMAAVAANRGEYYRIPLILRLIK